MPSEHATGALPLSPLEARVLAVLVEKEQTVPDTYPLTLNATTAGCNQKTSRDPVMSATESEVQQALDALRQRSFVIESSGGRVMRYAQNAKRVLDVPGAAIALLATLALRGPQTAAELRANADRLHRFADVSSVEAFLQELAERAAGALVVLLPRQPGAREARWAHLLCGADALPAVTASGYATSEPTMAAMDPEAAHRVDTLEREVADLRQQVARLDALVQRMAGELGVAV